MNFIFPYIYIYWEYWSQLTFIFFRGVETTNQKYVFFCINHRFFVCLREGSIPTKGHFNREPHRGKHGKTEISTWWWKTLTSSKTTTPPHRTKSQTQPNKTADLKCWAAMSVAWIHVRGLHYQTTHDEIFELFWRYGFHAEVDRVVRKGAYHPYQNNRCSAMVWLPSADIPTAFATRMKCGDFFLKMEDAIDNGQGLEPPSWLVRVAERDNVTCLHHLLCITWKQPNYTWTQEENMSLDFLHLNHHLKAMFLVNHWDVNMDNHPMVIISL